MSKSQSVNQCHRQHRKAARTTNVTALFLCVTGRVCPLLTPSVTARTKTSSMLLTAECERRRPVPMSEVAVSRSCKHRKYFVSLIWNSLRKPLARQDSWPRLFLRSHGAESNLHLTVWQYKFSIHDLALARTHTRAHILMYICNFCFSCSRKKRHIIHL